MPYFANIAFEGGFALVRRINALKEDLREKALRSAGYAGAEVFKEEAIRLAPYYTGPRKRNHPPPGTLKNSIIVKHIPEKSRPFKQTYYVTVRRGKKNSDTDAFYAHWVEYGHIYRPKGGALKGGAKSRASQRAKHIASGGLFVPAHPYMRPAYLSKRDEASERIKRRIGTFVAIAGGGVE